MLVRKNMVAVIQATGSRKIAKTSRPLRPDEGLAFVDVDADCSLRRRKRATFFSRLVR